jgi:hypothetical protein
MTRRETVEVTVIAFWAVAVYACIGHTTWRLNNVKNVQEYL